jgi:hypothetical protein
MLARDTLHIPIPNIHTYNTRDAWKQQNRLSRTEAKRRYITTLIDTMHKYASPSPDSRELVAELEFVWDQVKSNVPSSSSSSPLRTQNHIQSGYEQHDLGQSGRAAMGMSSDLGDTPARNQPSGDAEEEDRPLRIKSPMSQSGEELEGVEADIDREVFVDAPDSQYNPTSYPELDVDVEDAGVQTDIQQLLRAEPIPIQTPTPAPKKEEGQKESAADQKWRKRVEQSLMKMTAEVAALREQLEARRLFSHSVHYQLFRGVWRWVVAAVRHVAVDVFILGIVLLYMRRKGDRRLEGALRVVLGDAVKKVSRRVRLPLLGGGGKKGVD